jgi:uncharacterized protein
MRRSLFDPAPEQHYQKPRLKPNIFAQVAKFCFNNAYFIFLFWGFLSIGCAYLTIQNLKFKDVGQLEFTPRSQAAELMQKLDANFPNIFAISTATLSGQNSETLMQARKNLLAKLEERSDLFSTIFSPGYGNYYDVYGLLYLPTEQIQASVNYALALRPLFAAIAEQPNTASLATLINEVSASIEHGRNPQGLDTFFLEASNATNALMKKIERPVDWTQIANLRADANPLALQIIVIPKPGVEDQAHVLLQTLANEVAAPFTQVAEKISVSFNIGQIEKPLTAPVYSVQNLGPWLGLALIICGAILFAALGQMGFSLMVVLPTLAALSFAAMIFTTLFKMHISSIWCVVLCVGLLPLYFSTRFSCAVLEAFSLTHVRSSAIMLAAQRQGKIISGLCVAAAAPWFGWAVIGDLMGFKMACAATTTCAVGALASFTLVPAIAANIKGPLRWSAVEWVLPVYEALCENMLWRWFMRLCAVALIGAAFASLWFAPRLFERQKIAESQNQQPVYVLAKNEIAATQILKNLTMVPEAQSAQWLGMFLPPDAEAKMQILSSLKDKFTPVAPQQAQDPATIRDQISTLLDSLQSIANSTATRPALATLAHNFRRSLEVLSNTGTDEEIVQFEKRMFGAFNVLPEYASTLAELTPPDFSKLDAPLQSFFRSPQGVFRISVHPQKNVSSTQLASKLFNQGFPVANPVLQKIIHNANVFDTSLKISAASLLFGIIVLLFVLRNLSHTSILLLVFGVGIALFCAGAVGWREPVSLSLSLIFTTAASCLFLQCAAYIYDRHPAATSAHIALLAVERWLYIFLVAAIAVASALVNAGPATFVVVKLATVLVAFACCIEFIARPLNQDA